MVVDKFRQNNACKVILLLHRSSIPLTNRQISKEVSVSVSTITPTNKVLYENGIIKKVGGKHPVQYYVDDRDCFVDYIKFMAEKRQIRE